MDHWPDTLAFLLGIPLLGGVVLFLFFVAAQIKKQHQYQRYQVNEITDRFHFHFYRVAGRIRQRLSK